MTATKQNTMFEIARDSRGAVFSPCRVWRYALFRVWSSECMEPDCFKVPQMVAFVGLNPSTADETVDDPTVRRCIAFAKSWGYGGMLMLNAYAFRATDPAVMKQQSFDDAVGPANDLALDVFGRFADRVVCCWGNHCDSVRAARVSAVLNRRLFCFGVTSNGSPRHPLYLKSNTVLQEYRCCEKID